MKIIRLFALILILLSGCGGGFNTDDDNPAGIDNTIFGGEKDSIPKSE